MEDKRKRKEWIKTFAIIFLTVLLILTFFSKTIQNYSLPEVAAQYTNSGSITNKIRGQGVVETSDPYSVVYKQSRKIESVKVKVGDEVEKGDVLYVLEEGESENLKLAKSELLKLENDYRKAIITGAVPKKITSAVEAGQEISFENSQAKIEAAQNNINVYKAQLEEVNRQIELWTNGNADSLEERKELLERQDWLEKLTIQKAIEEADVASAQADVERKKAILDSYPAKDTSGNDVTGNDLTNRNNAQSEYDKAKKNLEEQNKQLVDITTQLAYQQANVDSSKKKLDDKLSDLNYQKSTLTLKLTESEENLKKLTDDITSQLDVGEQYKEIINKRKEVEELENEQGGAQITSPVSGRILTMKYVAGETIQKGETVSTIQVAGKGFTLSIVVPNEQASLVSKGDEGEITNSWWYSDIHARVASIRPDDTNPATSKKITFEIEGEVENGQTLSVTAGSRTANYDVIVPKSAVGEDNKGKYLYKVVTKSTPLGNRYQVERVDVKVLAEDDTVYAVSGALEGWDYVVTKASKPIEDGTLVRLKD